MEDQSLMFFSVVNEEMDDCKARWWLYLGSVLDRRMVQGEQVKSERGSGARRASSGKIEEMRNRVRCVFVMNANMFFAVFLETEQRIEPQVTCLTGRSHSAVTTSGGLCC